MGATSIEWTATVAPDGRLIPGYTFNPWIGCTKISPGCAGCYAEKLARRLGVKFGPGEPRRYPGENYWDQPIRWNKRAQQEGIRRRVFCASMGDLFDNEVHQVERDWLWELIEDTPHLDWLLMTKRIGNVKRMFPERWLPATPANVWLGATVVTQEEADRDIPKLLEIEAAVHFLSIEPMLEPMDVRIYMPNRLWSDLPTWQQPELDWVIVGGESGHGARPFVLGWGKEIVRQCQAAGVPVFVKQVGARPVNREGDPCPHILDRKGKVMEEWPEELRVREFPDASTNPAPA